MDLRALFEDTDTRAGRAFTLSVQFLIVLSLVTFSIETLPDLSPEFRSVLRCVEVCTVSIFTVEYFFRIAVAERKLGFVLSFYGMIDLIAILPFYVAVGVDLRAVRVFRLLRLLRVMKLVRYSRAVQRFHVAFRIAREEIILFTFVTLMLLYLSEVGIYYFEGDTQPEQFKSVFHSLWWSVATLTTVGYGDVYPVTVGGKVFTFFVLMIGLGIVAVPAGLVSSALAKAREEVGEELGACTEESSCQRQQATVDG